MYKGVLFFFLISLHKSNYAIYNDAALHMLPSLSTGLQLVSFVPAFLITPMLP